MKFRAQEGIVHVNYLKIKAILTSVCLLLKDTAFKCVGILCDLAYFYYELY